MRKLGEKAEFKKQAITMLLMAQIAEVVHRVVTGEKTNTYIYTERVMRVDARFKDSKDKINKILLEYAAQHSKI